MLTVRAGTGTLDCMINYAKIHAGELHRICRDGENVVDVISAMYSSGRERTQKETNTITFDPLNGLSVESWDDAALEAIGGLTLDVRRGTLGRELAEAAGNPMGFLVLTTQRLLVIDGLQMGTPPMVTWSTDRGSVAVLRHDPRFPLELGRLLVGFLDGSMVRLRAGVLSPVAARRFVASFSGTTLR